MKLNQLYSVVMHPKAPYAFDYSVENPTHYPAPIGDWEPGKMWFTLRWQGQKIGVRFENKGTVDKPAVEVSIYGKKPVEFKELLSEIAYRYEWNNSDAEFYNKFGNDSILKPLIEKYRGMHGFCGEELYDFIMITIFLQNTTAKRTAQMTRVMLEKYGTLLEFDGKKLYCFWSPEELVDVPEQDLRDLKVGYRAKSFLRVSKDFVDGHIDEVELRKLNTDDLRTDLLKIYGIGPASVMYALGGPFKRAVIDVIPPWEAKIYSKLLFNRDGASAEESMKELDRRYGKYKPSAIHFLFMDLAWKHRAERMKDMEKLLPFN
ncbi:hypothetical protein HOD83_01925 [Candidatus Woesearchaeota archaeon]|jgi:3-methyladenine DNA glycosylase/8-oxoguanine DNA glycosylase|nr:hypothetical protein [Candidatus Woesearchaeota archaeon]MBT4248323.1 hypothetical protein [Candidatus Woesearchaeota archaeon]